MISGDSGAEPVIAEIEKLDVAEGRQPAGRRHQEPQVVVRGGVIETGDWVRMKVEADPIPLSKWVEELGTRQVEKLRESDIPQIARRLGAEDDELEMRGPVLRREPAPGDGAGDGGGADHDA